MTIDSSLPEIKTLEPDAAVALWLKGKEEWNKWVDENPRSNISFSAVDFQPYRGDKNSTISFEGFQFPDGNVSFSSANFGKGNVSFIMAQFGDGLVDFNDSQFCDGYVKFFKTKFGNGEISFNFCKFSFCEVSFSKAKFGNGVLSFLDTKFIDGNVNFIATEFGDGDVHFFESKFGDCDVSFYKAKFGDGNFDFRNVKLGDGDVTFVEVEFGKGIKNFKNTKFGCGDVNFTRAKFGDGSVCFDDVFFNQGHVRFTEVQFGATDVCFDRATFCEGDVSFYKTKFTECEITFENVMCKARFTMEGNLSEIKSLSFRGSTFTNTVSLSNLVILSMLDLVNTKLTNQMSLHGVEVQLKRTRNRFGVKKAIDPADAERANRAKELAEANKHHALALRFHADEMRAKRWQSGTRVLSSTLDLVFDLLCNYGQSVFRPAMLWVFSIFAFVLPYAALATNSLTSVSQAFKLLIFSLSNSLPFLTSAGAARTEGLGKLFDVNITYNAVLPLMMAQGVVTVILMFLIGLGLRNRFRL